MRRAVKEARLFFLPPYSPDLNPIEQILPSSNISSGKQSQGPSRLHGERPVKILLAGQVAHFHYIPVAGAVFPLLSGI